MSRRAARVAGALPVAAVVLAAGAAPASAAEVAVTIPGKYFSPSSLSLVPGDDVVWRNADFVEHDVHNVEGLFDSGRLARFRSFSYRFTSPGAYRVMCTIHPFMTQSVNVHATLMSGPAGPVLPGEPVRLTGRAPAGTANVTVERESGPDAWEAVATAVPAGDGSFSASVSASESASFRAVTAGGDAGLPVAVTVTSRLTVDASVRRGAKRTVLSVRSRPAPKGALAVLQLYSRERFAWLRHGHVKLDARGGATFRLRAGVRRVARVLIVRSLRGPELGRSKRVALRRGAKGPARVIRPGTSHGDAPDAPADDHTGH